MAKEMENTYELKVDDPMVQSPGQTSNGDTKPVSTKSLRAATLDAAIEYEIRRGTVDPNMDKRHMRRVVSNRYAAKKAHDKKINKITELREIEKNLQDTITTLRPQIEHEQQLHSHLRFENKMLSQELQIRNDLKEMKEAEIAKNTLEREWLRGLLNNQLHQQPQNEDN